MKATTDIVLTMPKIKASFLICTTIVSHEVSVVKYHTL